MASIGEAEYAVAFHTAQTAARMCKNLSDLGYLQPATYIFIDNEEVTSGIASKTIEPKRTKSIDMQLHWLRDFVQMQDFIVIWRKYVYDLAFFSTKPFSAKDRQSVIHLLVGFHLYTQLCLLVALFELYSGWTAFLLLAARN